MRIITVGHIQKLPDFDFTRKSPVYSCAIHVSSRESNLIPKSHQCVDYLRDIDCFDRVLASYGDHECRFTEETGHFTGGT